MGIFLFLNKIFSGFWEPCNFSQKALISYLISSFRVVKFYSLRREVELRDWEGRVKNGVTIKSCDYIRLD